MGDPDPDPDPPWLFAREVTDTDCASSSASKSESMRVLVRREPECVVEDGRDSGLVSGSVSEGMDVRM